MCQSMVNIQSPTAEIRRGKKKEERNYRAKIYMVSLLHRATIIIAYMFEPCHHYVSNQQGAKVYIINLHKENYKPPPL